MVHFHSGTPPPSPKWLPSPERIPVFQRTKADESTIKALTLTAVELHELRTAYNRLASRSKINEEEWNRLRSQLEDKLREMMVLAAETERLVNQKLADMSRDIEEKDDKLRSLANQHSSLKNASLDSIQSLQKALQDLQSTCDDLEAQRKDLQEKLKEAEVSEGLRKMAETRVKELESAIAATRDRAKAMIGALQKEKADAEARSKNLARDLDQTQEALQQEAEQRQRSEMEAGRLAIESARLGNLLEIERLINAPLRETNYATTTLAHVMRSAARNVVGSHSTQPPGPSYLTSGPMPQAVGESFADRNLSKLGRSWSTTTPTAGIPYQAFEDNPDRFRPLYISTEGLEARQATETAGRGVGGGVLGAATIERSPTRSSQQVMAATATRGGAITSSQAQFITGSPARSTSARARPVTSSAAAAFLTPQKSNGKGPGGRTPGSHRSMRSPGPPTGHQTLKY